MHTLCPREAATHAELILGVRGLERAERGNLNMQSINQPRTRSRFIGDSVPVIGESTSVNPRFSSQLIVPCSAEFYFVGATSASPTCALDTLFLNVPPNLSCPRASDVVGSGRVTCRENFNSLINHANTPPSTQRGVLECSNGQNCVRHYLHEGLPRSISCFDNQTSCLMCSSAMVPNPEQ